MYINSQMFRFLYLIFLIYFKITHLSAEIVNDFKIEGNNRVSNETIYIFSKIKKGDDISNADLNNISESSFVGSVAVLTGSLSGMWDTGQGYQYPASNQLIPKHGKAVSADMDFVFNSNMMIGGQFFQSGSITRNPNSGAIINAILAGGVFAIAPSGSLQIVSGSVESLEGQSFILKAPGSAFDSSGTARGSFHDKKRVTNVKGARDEFQLKKLREEKTSNFVSTGRKMTTNPLK